MKKSRNKKTTKTGIALNIGLVREITKIVNEIKDGKYTQADSVEFVLQQFKGGYNE